MVCDVAGADTFEDLVGAGGSDDLATDSAPRLLEVMDLCAEKRLAHDAYDDFLSIGRRAAGPTAWSTGLAPRAENAGRQRMGKVRRVGEGLGAITTVSLGFLFRVGPLGGAIGP